MIRRGLINVVRTDRATLLCIIALVVLPVAMFTINRSYLYTIPGDLDPWVYAGYHVHLPAMWRFSPWAYYGTRVPYTATGYIIYRLFGAEPSLFILAALQFYVATFSLFYTIRVLFQNPVAAFVAACLLGTNSWFLWAIGWKYIDGASIACVLLSFAALTAAARQTRWRTSMLVWGAAMAATAALYLMYVVLLPVEIAAFVVLNWFGSRRPILPVAVLLCAGFIGNVLLMGLVNWSLGGNFDYFRPTLNILNEVGSASEAAAYYSPWHFWIWNASWLLLPAFAYVASWVVIATRGPSLLRNLKGEVTPASSEAGLVALAIACLLAVSGFAYMQLRHYNVLQIWYHENVLLPFAFLVIGACFALGLSRLQSNCMLVVIAASGPLLCLTPWILAALGYIHLPLPVEPIVGAGPGSLLLPAPHILSGKLIEPLWVLTGAGLLIGGFMSRRWLFPLAATVFLSMLSIITIPGNLNIDPGPPRPLVRDYSLIIYDIARFIDDTPGSRPIAFWWDIRDPKLGTFYSLGEMYIWNPFVPPVVTPDERVVFVTSSNNMRMIERTLVNGQHVKLHPIKTKHFQRDTIGIDVAIADVTGQQRPAAESRVPGGPLVAYRHATIPLRVFSPGAHAGPILIQTPVGAWQYAAEARIPNAIHNLKLSSATLHVRLRVNKGIIGVGATTGDGSTFLNRTFFIRSADLRDAYIYIPRFSDAWQIVISNGDTSASSSITIYSVEVLYK